jgi:regulator of sigma E protease
LSEAAVYAVKWPFAKTVEQLVGIATLIQRRSTEGLQGPIGMGERIAEQAARGAEYYIPFMALISVALGLFNLLPFPALDGGRLVFLGFELVTRRRANEKVEAIVHTVGIIFLLGVIVLVTFRDVMS